MNAHLRLVTVVASLVLCASAFGEMTEIGPHRRPSGMVSGPLKAYESPGGDITVWARRSPASTVLCGEIISEQTFDRLVFVVGLCLFIAWTVGGMKSARLVAIPAGACLAVLVQILFLSADAEDWGDGSPLYPNILLRVLSCVMVAGFATAGTSFHIRPSPASHVTQLARATVPALLVAGFAFEVQYFFSRIDLLSSPASLSSADRLMPLTLIIFFAVWLASYLYLLHDSCQPSPGSDCAADGTPGAKKK